jgi:hypothetical protein
VSGGFFFHSVTFFFFATLLSKSHMLYVTIALFAIAAVIGIIILKNWLTSANTSRTVVYLHGIFAAVALILLLVQTLRNPAGQLRTSLILFAVAAAGGFYMFFQDLKGKFSPTWLAVVHALLAIGGFAFLILTVI